MVCRCSKYVINMHFVHFGNVIGCNNMLMLKVCKSFCKLLQVFGAFILFHFMLHVREALACYMFDTYQPILIIFFVDNNVVTLSTVCKYYSSCGHFCVTAVRQQGQCYQLCGCCNICCCWNNGRPTQ